MSQINTEYGLGTNLNAYRGTTYYTSSAGPFTFPAGTISMNNFRGTQANAPVTISLSTLTNKTLNRVVADISLPASVELFFSPLGFWLASDDLTTGGDWATPNSSGIGSSYWLKWTANFVNGGVGTYSATSAWLGLSTGRQIQVTRTGNPSSVVFYTIQYTVQISSSSSGSPVVTTATNVNIGISNV